MVTEISGAGLSHSVVSQVGAKEPQRVAESVRPEVLDAQTSVVASDESKFESKSPSTKVAGLYAKLLTQQDSIGKAASVVREVGAIVEKADQLLSKMEEKLGSVVKMYPPYPVDNPERVSLLNSFGGLRRQIDALTFPPPERLDALGRLVGTRGGTQEDVAKDAEKSAQVFVRVPTVSLIKEPMWDIPTLDPLASGDAEVSKALVQVKSTRSILEDLQSGMWKDVIGFVQQADSSEVQNQAGATREQLAGLVANSAERGERGIGNNASQLALAVETK